MSRPFKYNQEEYKFYVCNYKTGRIFSGWEYKEDALDAAKDLPKGSNPKVYTKSYCIQQGIDINHNPTWED